jgi:hypothetical protein
MINPTDMIPTIIVSMIDVVLELAARPGEQTQNYE